MKTKDIVKKHEDLKEDLEIAKSNKEFFLSKLQEAQRQFDEKYLELSEARTQLREFKETYNIIG
tara:strand:- start:483 stop:674 length:192 start_codon:yes stop_codon:yes gene_type:complete